MLHTTVAPLGPLTRGVFDVTAYGADPTATHDSTDAIQAAVHAAMDNATHRSMGTVLFPSGSYAISRTINVTRSAAGDSSGVVLLGSGVAEVSQQCFGCDVFFGAPAHHIASTAGATRRPGQALAWRPSATWRTPTRCSTA